jgi:hypothetical protein
VQSKLGCYGGDASSLFVVPQIRSMLRTQLAALQPVELVLPPKGPTPLKTASSTAGGIGEGSLSEATALALAAAPGGGSLRRNVTRGGQASWTRDGARKVSPGDTRSIYPKEQAQPCLAFYESVPLTYKAIPPL